MPTTRPILPETICGFLIAHRSDHGFLVAEMGIKEDHRAALPNLFYPVIGSYEEGQTVGGRVYLPNEPDLTTVLQHCFNPLTQKNSDELMVRPINLNIDIADLMMPCSQHTGIFWLLDQV